MEMTRKYKVQCFLFSSSDTMIKNYKPKSSFTSLPFAVFIQQPQNSSIPVFSLQTLHWKQNYWTHLMLFYMQSITRLFHLITHNGQNVVRNVAKEQNLTTVYTQV